MRTYDYIDSKNQLLWDEVSKLYNISIEQHTDPNYLLNTKSDNAIIYVPDGTPNKSSFTHELLHLKVKSLGVNIDGAILMPFVSDPVLRITFLPELPHHIANAIEHMFMLPIFLEMGYPRNEFIQDYNERKILGRELEAVQYFFNEGGDLGVCAIDAYVGKFFGMKSCPNPAFNYDSEFEALNKLNPELHSLLSTFWDAIFALDKENFNELRLIAYQFCDDLGKWVKDHMQVE